MPTKARTDANALDAGARAVHALHALSSSTRQLDPSESYYIVRDLLACVRHLAQVAQHTAAAPAASGLAPGLKNITDAVSARLDAVQTYLANAEIDLDVAASHAIRIFDVTPRRPITAEPGSLYPLPTDNASSPPRPFPAPPGPALRDRPRQGPTL